MTGAAEQEKRLAELKHGLRAAVHTPKPFSFRFLRHANVRRRVAAQK